jgi:hypothetical protein
VQVHHICTILHHELRVKLEVYEARTHVLQLRWYSAMPCDIYTILKKPSQKHQGAIKNTVQSITEVNL